MRRWFFCAAASALLIGTAIDSIVVAQAGPVPPRGMITNVPSGGGQAGTATVPSDQAFIADWVYVQAVETLAAETHTLTASASTYTPKPIASVVIPSGGARTTDFALAPSALVTLVVNSTLDAVDMNPGDGVCATAGGVCTLRAAIQEANALGGTDVITLPAGTYILTIPGKGEYNAATGDLNVKTNITINGAGAATTIIDANSIDRVFQAFSPGILTLDDLTVRNGNPASLGGCIYFSSGTQLTLTRAFVNGCTGSGGGIIVFGTGTVSTLTLTDTTITQNASTGIGGGVYLAGSGVTATINRTTISGNSGTTAGGLFSQGTVTIANTTLSGNTATAGSGAIETWESATTPSMTLVNVTVASNSSSVGGAVRLGLGSLGYHAQIQARNTIIANSSGAAPSNCQVDAGSALTSLGNNLEFPGITCGFSLGSDRRVDPLLAALAANGGPTQTHALLGGSPAAELGDDPTCFATPVSGVDQRGVSRPYGAHCDTGAYERRTVLGDFEGDAKTDRTVFRPSTGVWYSALSNGGATASHWGTTGDIDVAGDYDGDGKAEVAVFRPSTGVWYIIQSSNGAVRVDNWGTSGDIPLVGDVDGDGKADLVIWRQSTGVWYLKKSSGGVTAFGWGTSGDLPLLGDFDGDGKADLTIYRPSTGVWYISYAGGGWAALGWGTSGDIPVSGDFDGDGKSDPTVFRPSTGQWFVNKSTGGYLSVVFGTAGDIPISGDWDGDLRSDFTVWRDSSGVWYTQYAVGGSAVVGWGMSGDKPTGRRPGS